ncbi:hypothetical protein [Paraburkholderia strydomiana]|uniref:hypothetical protein n=1 Tax=Paraburkholderia strydomiana TaxID=1245417 RepID=UPI00286AD22C|nr:hypothetical protein [Paraburkholderia strydomiana]
MLSIVCHLSGCGFEAKDPVIVECTDPKSCYSVNSIRDNACKLPNDPENAIRYRNYIEVKQWAKPSSEIQIGVLRETWTNNGIKSAEKRDNPAIFARNSKTDVGCSHGIENGTLVQYKYGSWCNGFEGGACIASKAKELVSENFPNTCSITIDEPSIRSKVSKTKKMLDNDKNYPIPTDAIYRLFSTQPVSCERDNLTKDPADKSVISNPARQSCQISAAENIQGQKATISVGLPPLLKAQKTAGALGTTYAFYDGYSPIVNSFDNTNVNKIIGGSMSGLRFRTNNTTDIFIKRLDGTTTCVSVRH